MSQQEIIVLLNLIPGVLWVILIAILIAIFYKPIRYDILPKLGAVKIFSALEVTFIRESLDRAVEAKKLVVSYADRSRIMRRAQRVAPILEGARILWVDDRPDNNINERAVLDELGIKVDPVTTSAIALSMIEETKYDLVISDMKRIGDEKAGITFLEEMKNRKIDLYNWTIFYIGSDWAYYDNDWNKQKPKPPVAFGLTNRPDDLFHLILDILERRRS